MAHGNIIKKDAISSATPLEINIEINFNVNKTYAIGLWLPFNVHIIQTKRCCIASKTTKKCYGYISQFCLGAKSAQHRIWSHVSNVATGTPIPEPPLNTLPAKEGARIIFMQAKKCILSIYVFAMRHIFVAHDKDIFRRCWGSCNCFSPLVTPHNGKSIDRCVGALFAARHHLW